MNAFGAFEYFDAFIAFRSFLPGNRSGKLKNNPVLGAP
jgi:hypothetical protein